MNILGIHDGHDASACLLQDGQIICGVQEERFSNLKGDYGFPKDSVDFCLNFGNTKNNEIDKVVLASFTTNPVLMWCKRNANFKVSDWVDEQRDYWYPMLFKKNIKINYGNLFSNREDFQYDKYYPMDNLVNGYMDTEEMERF